MFNRKNLLKNRGQLLITFGTLGSPTCGFHLLLFSAGTPSAFIPALFTVPAFPQVRFPLSYLRFSPSTLFHRYTFLFHTCAFLHSAFPQVHFPLSYLRFSPSRLFRSYTFHFHTCASHRSGFSAGTLPASIPALFIIYSFPQVLFRLVFHDAFLIIKTSDLAVLNAEGGILLVGHLVEVGLHRTGNPIMRHEQISFFLRLRL